jgi:YVTN family beta-propeller protein
MASLTLQRPGRLLAVALLLAGADAPADPLPLAHVADLPLTGSTSRWDYASLDPQRHLLFLAHLGDSVVTVLDTRSQKVVADIPDVGHVHGVLALPELNRVYASATRSDEVVAIDAATLKVTARMPGGVYPDGMAYAPEAHRLFVSDETGTTETVIDTQTNQRVATIHLWSTVGNTQYDPASKHVFVNAQLRNQLVEIDPVRNEIIARYDLPGADGPHGLLIDPASRQAFIACEGNDKLLVMDLKTMKLTASFDVGGDPDVLAFDPGLRRLYVAGEQGIVSVFGVEAAGVRKIGEGMVGNNAHVVAVDPETHRVYFPLKDFGGAPLLRIMKPR